MTTQEHLHDTATRTWNALEQSERDQVVSGDDVTNVPVTLANGRSLNIQFFLNSGDVAYEVTYGGLIPCPGALI